MSDCQKGIIFDGLETVFSQNMYTAALAILTALNNRTHLYFVTMKLDYSELKKQEQAMQEEQGKQRNMSTKLVNLSQI